MQKSWSEIKNLWGFQPTICGPKTKQPVETHLRPQQSEQILQGREI